jgi:signal transduction histidine kinase
MTRSRIVALVLVVGVAIILEGLAATRIGYAAFDFRYAVLALLTGWLVATCGLVAWLRTPGSRVGPLLMLVALTWFIGGFRWVAWEPAAQLAAALDLLFLAVASHAVLTFPSGHSRSLTLSVVIVAGYAAAIVPAPRADVLVGAILLVGIVIVVLRGRGAGRDQRRALLSGTALALAVGSYRLVPAAIGGLAWLDTRPVLLLAMGGMAVVLAIPLARRHGGAGRVADLIVELESSPRVELLRDLGELVGDPEARLGMWYQAGGHFVDVMGRPVEEPAAGSGRVTTLIRDGDEPLAALIHAADVHPDAGVLSAIRMAARLSLEHARLQADVRAQLFAVRASRRRLLLAGDEERARLELRLRDALGARISALEAALRSPALRSDTAATAAIDHLAETQLELDALIAGIGPPVVDRADVRVAFVELAATSPVPLEVRVEVADIPSRETRSALIFVAREALANIGKHAMATSASLRLSSRDGIVRLDVTDDGRGGAHMGNGSGLVGLRDRVEALGGKLTLASGRGRGTHVSASLPLEDAAW